MFWPARLAGEAGPLRGPFAGTDDLTFRLRRLSGRSSCHFRATAQDEVEQCSCTAVSLRGVGLQHCRIHHRSTCQPPQQAPSYIERDEEPERVVGESDLLEADGGPKLQDFVKGDAEDELDVGLSGFIKQRRQDQPNATGSITKR